MARKSPLARTAEIQQAINACLQEIPGRAPSEYRILSMMGERISVCEDGFGPRERPIKEKIFTSLGFVKGPSGHWSKTRKPVRKSAVKRPADNVPVINFIEYPEGMVSPTELDDLKPGDEIDVLVHGMVSEYYKGTGTAKKYIYLTGDAFHNLFIPLQDSMKIRVIKKAITPEPEPGTMAVWTNNNFIAAVRSPGATKDGADNWAVTFYTRQLTWKDCISRWGEPDAYYYPGDKIIQC